MSGDHHGFTAGELRRLRSFRSPAGIQRFLDSLPYHDATTAWSPRRVLREQTAHCLEAALLAAAALRALGEPPLVLDMEGERDTDHVIALFKRRSGWGAVAGSNFTGLRYREPIYRDLRELVMSYFDDYFNLRGERTLRTYSRPVDLARFDRFGWMTSEKSVWYIPEYLVHVPHIKLFTPAVARRFARLDRRSMAGGLVGAEEWAFGRRRRQR